VDDDNTTDAAHVESGTDLADLSAQIDALEGAQEAGQAARQAAQTEQQVHSAQAELFGALQMARMMVAPMMGWWDQFPKVWSDETLQSIAEGGAMVMQRHGWTMGGVMGQFGPYIALGGATIPPALVTYQAIQHRKAEQEARRHERAQPPQD
jgi:hypothetical protein